MKTKAFIFFSLLICNLLPAQNVKLDIVPHFFGVRADSLFLSMDISVHIKDMVSRNRNYICAIRFYARRMTGKKRMRKLI